MPLVRTNVTLPAETLAIIDEVAGPRGRSAWIAEVLLKQAKRERMKKVWEENRGALKGSTTWGTTPEESLRDPEGDPRLVGSATRRCPVGRRRSDAPEAPGHDAPDRSRRSDRPAPSRLVRRLFAEA